MKKASEARMQTKRVRASSQSGDAPFAGPRTSQGMRRVVRELLAKS